MKALWRLATPALVLLMSSVMAHAQSADGARPGAATQDQNRPSDSQLSVPAPIIDTCTPGPFIIFFDWDKSSITRESAAILDNAVANYPGCGTPKVVLSGHADRSGPAGNNIAVSQRRADSVKAYLIAKGISRRIISTNAFGESRLRVPTADGVREFQNRRVEIDFEPDLGQ